MLLRHLVEIVLALGKKNWRDESLLGLVSLKGWERSRDVGDLIGAATLARLLGPFMVRDRWRHLIRSQGTIEDHFETIVIQ